MLNSRGHGVPSRAIDRVELVSLLTQTEPSVYEVDNFPTMQRVQNAKRRPLDEFEQRALELVYEGEQIVRFAEQPTRMFGGIRAETRCLKCHMSAKEGDLLGAFSYFFTVPINFPHSKVSRVYSVSSR